MHLGKIGVAGAFLVGCCSIGVHALATPPATTAQTLFDFHTGFWINLHHFLYLEAAAQKPNGPRAPTVSPADGEIASSLTREEHAAWDATVSYYQQSVIQRDLLFGQGMNAIKNQLEDAEASSDLGNADIPAPLRDVLLKASPIYRKHWWPGHDRENRTWIEKLKPLLDAHGTALHDSLVRIYESPWPGQPVRVDVTVYAGPFAAYTTNDPTRPTLSSTDPRNQGTAGRRDVGVGQNPCLIEGLPAALVAGVRWNDVQCQVVTVLPDQDDAGRLVTTEAQQFDCVASDVEQGRRVVPAVMVVAHHNDRPKPLGYRRHQAR